MISETPWAILPQALASIVEIVDRHVAGELLSDEEIQERLAGKPARRNGSRAGMVAVLPLYGVVAPRATLMSNISGGTSLYDFRVAFGDALADPDVAAILIDVDSPGGSTDLVPEMAADIRAARGRKPIVAIANTLAASAAYWLASQADELVVTPSGEVGSIGVFAAHDDVSALQERMGVKTTLISAGKYKVEANPFEPLSADAKAAIQATVDEFYGMFVRDVARGRNVSVQQVRDGFGEGRVVTAKNAVRLGMADRVETYEATVSRMLGATPGGRAKASLLFAGDIDPATNEVDESLETLEVEVTSGADSTLGTTDELQWHFIGSGLAEASENFIAFPDRDAKASIADLLEETEVERLKRESAAALELGRADRRAIEQRKYQLPTHDEHNEGDER